MLLSAKDSGNRYKVSTREFSSVTLGSAIRSASARSRSRSRAEDPAGAELLAPALTLSVRKAVSHAVVDRKAACAAALGIFNAAKRAQYKRYLIRRFPMPTKRGLIYDAEHHFNWRQCDPSGTPTRPESPNATLRALLHIPELRRLVVSFLICSSAASRKFIREMAVQHGVDRERAQRILDEL